jgi:hypothetical protein
MAIILFLAFLLILGPSRVSDSAVGANAPADAGIPTIGFCDLAHTTIEPNQEIRVRAVYRVGFEWAQLYSLKCIDAPSVWVEFAEGWQDRTRRAVRKEINKNDGSLGSTFGVTFVGRLSSGGGFGHMGEYVMRFNVTSIQTAKRLFRPSNHPKALTPEMRRRVQAFENAGQR